ncbi:MAG: PTS glucose transporter subunit IIA [Hespellia sp.]|nr:PTS glucose transporter subunit IIA [Hespellia sp.]
MLEEMIQKVMETEQKKKKIEMIYAPLVGRMAELEKVEKDIFEQTNHHVIKIIPTEGKIYAPFDGEVSVITPSKHAIVVKDEWENEVFIHVGRNTVELEGKFFHPFVQSMDRIKQGQKILTFEMEKIIEAGYRLDSIIYITNKGNPVAMEQMEGEITKETILYERTI